MSFKKNRHPAEPLFKQHKILNWQNKQQHFYSTGKIVRRLSKSIVGWNIHMVCFFVDCVQSEKESVQLQVMQWFNDWHHKKL